MPSITMWLSIKLYTSESTPPFPSTVKDQRWLQFSKPNQHPVLADAREDYAKSSQPQRKAHSLTNCGFAKIEIVSFYTSFPPTKHRPPRADLSRSTIAAGVVHLHHRRGASALRIRKIELSENFSRFVPGSFSCGIGFGHCTPIDTTTTTTMRGWYNFGAKMHPALTTRWTCLLFWALRRVSRKHGLGWM